MNNGEQESRASTPLRHAYEVLRALTDELERELDVVSKTGPKNQDDIRTQTLSQVERRILIRSIFSYIEAITFALKALVLSHPYSSKLTEGERVLASEVSYDLKSTGDVSVRSAKLSLASNVRFTFKIFATVFESWTPLDTGGHDWECFQRSIKVRDRITHPKRATDLFITGVELDEANSAIIWFYQSQIRASLEWLAASRDRLKKLEKHAAAIVQMKGRNQVPAKIRTRIEKALGEGREDLPEALASLGDKLIEDRDRLAEKEASSSVNERPST